LKKANILSFGFNKLGDIEGNQPGIHAEHDAINKLKPLNRKKRLENINLLVIRFSKNNKLGNSKPCANCIQVMKNLPGKKGYKIRNIYYSDDNGAIIKSSLKNLENDELHYSRFYKKQLISSC
jgi:cytidine deaminase